MPHPDRRGSGVARLLTREQVAEILGCSLDTVDRRITQGKLPALRDGRLVRVMEDDLRAYIRRSKQWR
jgi:excisionase family DNA binding protein